MHQIKEITQNIYWVGGNDRRLALFENVFPVPRGVSYNSYLLLDEKTVLFDTIDHAASRVFYANLAFLLKDRQLDYVVINHVEPDHCGSLGELILHYPALKIIGNKLTHDMLLQFFDFNERNFDFESRFIKVKEGDVFETGAHKLTFLMAPMVHWPEVMVTYEITQKILFSADAFGTFGALNGAIFADEVNFERDWLPDARRYYSNIVGKYGNQVQMLLAKAANHEISLVCPLHGPVWRKNFDWYLEKYQRWSSYTPEESAVMIAYGSVYGNTENAVNILASELSGRGIRNIQIFDVSKTHFSEIIAEAFRCSHLVFASSTYNAEIFCNMETLLLALKEHNLQNRTVALLENGSWAATSGKLMREIISSMKNMRILDCGLSIKSSLKAGQYEDIVKLAEQLDDFSPAARGTKRKAPDGGIANEAFFKMSYGLFLLGAKDLEKDNACIINTFIQITDTPKRAAFAVNKSNYTHDIIKKTGLFTVSVLSTDTPFSLFQRYGFKSGRDCDKFDGVKLPRGANGIVFDDENACAFVSGKVISSADYGTHTLFIAEITEAALLSDAPQLTYQYYFDNIKPKPPVGSAKKSGWVCKVCGYVHEGKELPPDIICPLCKHGAADFEKLGA
ncbi:MAG: flavin reductase [Spirochaetaceae bacterium]|jgi:flavorubredoxin/flavin reductase (DIM6/NTAB) family NADH-FMN oxidoreductase RutF|nr:flavin reductase [Spirochaetaceae bacterium]